MKNQNKRQKNKNFLTPRFFSKSRKAEITSTQIVTMVLLIAGFAILLYVFNQVGFTKEIDREICHESVILRMTLPDTFDLKNLPSLRCKTKRICIADNLIGKGDCQNDLGDEYETIKISKDKKEREKQINAFIAQELADCWSMMGEGKGQIFTRDISTKNRCSVCSRIAFDENLKKELSEIRGIGDYLIFNKIPNTDITYWKFLTNTMSIVDYDFSLDKFSTEQKAIVFMEITRSTWDIWAGRISGGVSLGLVGSTIGSVIPGFGTASGFIVGFIGGFIEGGSLGEKAGEKILGEEFSPGWHFIDYDKEGFQKLECYSLENIS